MKAATGQGVAFWPREETYEETGINVEKKKFEESSNRYGDRLGRENKATALHVF